MSYSQHSKFIKLATGEYPFLEGDVRLEHPEIPESATWPNFPCPPTFAVVHWELPPEHNVETHTCFEQAPQLVDGVWRINWGIRPLTEAELEANRKEKEQEAAFLAQLQTSMAQQGSSEPVELKSEDFNVVIDLTPMNP